MSHVVGFLPRHVPQVLLNLTPVAPLRHLSEGSLALRLRLDTATGDRVTKRVLVRAAGGKSKIKSNG